MTSIGYPDTTGRPIATSGGPPARARPLIYPCQDEPAFIDRPNFCTSVSSTFPSIEGGIKR